MSRNRMIIRKFPFTLFTGWLQIRRDFYARHENLYYKPILRFMWGKRPVLHLFCAIVALQALHKIINALFNPLINQFYTWLTSRNPPSTSILSAMSFMIQSVSALFSLSVFISLLFAWRLHQLLRSRFFNEELEIIPHSHAQRWRAIALQMILLLIVLLLLSFMTRAYWWLYYRLFRTAVFQNFNMGSILEFVFFGGFFSVLFDDSGRFMPFYAAMNLHNLIRQYSSISFNLLSLSLIAWRWCKKRSENFNWMPVLGWVLLLHVLLHLLSNLLLYLPIIAFQLRPQSITAAILILPICFFEFLILLLPGALWMMFQNRMARLEEGEQ
ncbi:hypothetical protein JXA32_15930 [Candidatus Sumerlaeota bacterium]|nr:hypothetical protein [Candidatus Sumerlaeota bacterium]